VYVFALLTVLAGVLGAMPAQTAQAATQSTPTITTVRVDGVLYSRAQFTQRFGQQDLHWVLDTESEARGILIVYTTEARRNAALGLTETNFQQPTTGVLTTYATLWRDRWKGGQAVAITGHAYDLRDQSFNDAASSVETLSKEIILYEHSNHGGCSLYIQSNKYISYLNYHTFCNSLFGTWNDKTSSVKVVF
jgi:hypothetical protein